MPVKLECDMRLTLAATEHLLIETVSYRGITALPSDQVRSPFYSRFRLMQSQMIFPISWRETWTDVRGGALNWLS